MRSYKDHLLQSGTSIREALVILDRLAEDAIVFVVDGENKLVGSLTDGDVRRGLLKGITIDEKIDNFIHTKPRFLIKGQQNTLKVIEYREGNLKIIPILDETGCVVNVINFNHLRSYLPVDAVIMAGGRGTRLKPMTDTVPKPMLKVGSKPILEHNIDRLCLFGIDDFWISINYLGEQIEQYFGDGSSQNTIKEYVREDRPLGTIGALSQISNFRHNYVLVTNSDILTDLNYEDLFLHFIKEEADFSVVTIPYQVGVPYAVLETLNGKVLSLKEKPKYTYYSNGGIYLMKKEIAQFVPKDTFYNTTDLIEALISAGKKVVSYPLNGYWLDIGKPEDFEKAQKDINYLKV